MCVCVCTRVCVCAFLGNAGERGFRGRCAHHLQRQVLAGDDGEGAELSYAKADKGSAQHAAVYVLDQDILEQRMHSFEIGAHFLCDGPVHLMQSLCSGGLPRLEVMMFIKVLCSFRMQSELMYLD